MRYSARCPCTVLRPKMPGPSKRALVAALRVGDVHLAADRVDRHVEQDRADAGPEAVPSLVRTGGVALALMAKTSLSGRLNFTALSQMRPQVLPGQSLSCWQAQPAFDPPTHTRSTQCVPSYLHDEPGLGPRARRLELVCGSGRPPGTVTPLMVHAPWTVLLARCVLSVSQTAPSLMVVVRLPVWKPAAYTVLPSGLTASARGVSAKSTIGVPATGVPPSDAAEVGGVEHPHIGAADAGASVRSESSRSGSRRCSGRDARR